MKKIIIILISILFAFPSNAKHVTGGEVNYKYLGQGSAPNSKRYRITLKLFRDDNCVSCALMPTNVTMGIFNNDNNQSEVANQVIPLTSTSSLPIVSSPSCLDNPPQLSYTAGFYSFDIELNDNAAGYSITYQTCCRIDGIANSSDMVGSSFVGTLPGNNTLLNGASDNGSSFQDGISIICFNQPFVLDFSATDIDGDILKYNFENAYNGGLAMASAFSTPAAPPYGSVPYINGFSGAQPLGPLATINPTTGIISGIAPAAGKYIVCVAVKSFKNGLIVSETRKDFIVTVAPCTAVSATLKPAYTFCDFGNGGGLSYTFTNESNSPLNLTTNWNFGDPSTGANNNFVGEPATHTYSGPGDYVLTLVVNQGQSCERTATSIVKVYPGFFPNIAPILPQCKNVPLAFSENGTTNFGVIDYWKWDFDEMSPNILPTDTSRLQNTFHTYPNAGMYTTSLIVKNSKGCIDTLSVPVTITENASLIITRDTLICVVDTLQLNSNFNTGNITWSPNYMISNVNSFNPLVSPDITTTYTASYVSPTGCSAVKTVIIKVVTDVTLLAINDTIICRTDTARINTNTDALYFTWTPSNVIIDPTIRNPLVFPTAPSTLFHVKASISNKCFKETDVRVTTVPYPVANITGINTICYGDNSQLTASGGSTYLWTPATFLNNPNIPNPQVIKPSTSITYKVQVNDNLGCPKPVFKTFSLTVIKLSVDAGPADTSIVINQPLQLNATTVSGTIFNWTPSSDLSSSNILNPLSSTSNDIVYKIIATNNIGCSASDSIRVKVYNLPPDIYIPSAFSPDGDGVNDVIRPIALGIKQLENFRVYNRFGELLFKTSTIGKGWDGNYKGEKQLPGTYVWQADAIDYKNKKISRKGSVILIR